MDARAHVQAGLIRLLRGDPALWPVADRQRFLHRLLDETGSDHRALAVLLLRAWDAEIPQRLDAAAARGTPWGESAAPHVVGLASEHFIQPEMARWAVETWGMALGHYVAPKPVAAPVTSTTSAWRAPQRAPVAASGPPPFAGPPARGGGVLGTQPRWQGPVQANPPGTPGWVKHGKVPPTPRYIQGSLGTAATPPPPGSITLFGGAVLTPSDVRGIAILGGLYVFGMAFLWFGIRSVREDDVARPLGAAVVATRAPALTGAHARDSARAVEAMRLARRDSLLADASRRTQVAMPPVERRIGTSPNVVALSPDSEATPSAILPDELRPWRGRYVAARAPEMVPGRWTVRADVQGVSGSRSCDAVWRSLAPGRESVEAIALGALVRGDLTTLPGVEFHFTSRPGLRGTIHDDGSFQTVPLRSMREGVGYEYRMAGRFADGAFEAEAEAVTRTTLRFGDPQVCSVRTRLSGRRIAAGRDGVVR